MRVSLTGPTAVRRRSRTGLSYLITSGLLWGTGGLTGALLGHAAGLSAIAVAAFRLLGGGGLIVAFRTLARRPWPTGRAVWTRIAVTGLLAAIYQGCYFAAVSVTSVSLATLVTIGAAPVIVQAAESAGGRRLPGRRLPGRRPAGRSAVVTTGLALAGLGLLVGPTDGGFPEAAMLAGVLLALLAAGSFAATTLIGSSPVPGLDDLTVTGFGFTVGGLALLPLAAVAGGIGFRPSPAAFGMLIVLATGPTAVAYTLYFRGLRTAAASTAALLTLLEPLTAAILAALILGDRLSMTGIAGAGVLAVAVIGAVRANRLRGGLTVLAAPPGGQDPSRGAAATVYTPGYS